MKLSVLTSVVLSAAASAQFGPEHASFFYGPECVIAVDIDGDTFDDVVAARGLIQWFRNVNGEISTTSRPVAHLTNGGYRIVAGDMDGDGDQDLVSCDRIHHTIRWHENLGGGQFAPGEHIGSTLQPNGVCVIDFDNDGDLDVAYGGWEFGEVGFVLNLGGGSFVQSQLLSGQIYGVLSVGSGDLDGDGDPDVLVAATSPSNRVSWFENLGGTGVTFGPEQTIGSGLLGAREAVAADLDRDSDADVLFIAADEDKVAWLENLGNGTFGAQRVLTTQCGQARSVFASDLDADGDFDVLAASQDDNEITWIENLGAGFFGPEQVGNSTAEWAWCVYAADLNRDGYPEPLSASLRDNSVSWYENYFVPILTYCDPVNINSSGRAGSIQAQGPPVVAANALSLLATNLAVDSFGYFLCSQTMDEVPNYGGSTGLMCLGGAIGRFVGPGQISSSGATGSISLNIDLTSMPTPVGPMTAVAGQVWHFQCWFRDSFVLLPSIPPFASSNMTNAVRVRLQ